LNREREDILGNFLDELNKCQDDSMGMNFLTVIGDVLGYKLLPRWVERKHFEIVVRCLVIEKTDVADLERFYRLNINR